MRAALVALVATGIVIVAAPQPVTALPAGCTNTWDGGAGTDVWENPVNWSGNVLPGASAVACVPAFFTVTIASTVSVSALHLDGTSLFLDPGSGLFVTGATASVWDAGTFVFADQARLGGPGRIELHGVLNLTGGSALTSIDAPSGAAYGGAPGSLVVTSGAELDFVDAVSVRTRYELHVFGLGLVQSDSLVSADWGVAMGIYPGGRFELTGDGGWYQGAPVAGQAIAVIGNHGALAKTGGGSTSVVDANYLPSGAGHVEVDCCATLAISGQQLISGQLLPDMSLGTAACGVQTTTICGGSQNPAVDAMSVKLDLDPDNPATGAAVQELGTPADTEDSRALGNDVYAHADVLAGPADPATLTLRLSQADVMATPLAEVQVGHISDAGVMTKTPDCISGTIPPGAPYCVVRPVTRDALNTFVTVLTTQTSRWRLRRQLPGESFDQTAPGAARNLVATLAPPGDGSKVALSWAAPTTDGGAAVSAYRVLLDGKLLFANDVSITSAVVSEPGPGKHSLSIVAVNSIGAGAGVVASITIDKLSKPRKVNEVQGKKGGKLTAGAKWKAPADAGGFAITKYKVAVFKKNGKKVDTKVVKADQLKFLFKLKPGKYFLKVKARNTDRWGPWSKPTDLVRPR